MQKYWKYNPCTTCGEVLFSNFPYQGLLCAHWGTGKEQMPESLCKVAGEATLEELNTARAARNLPPLEGQS